MYINNLKEEMKYQKTSTAIKPCSKWFHDWRVLVKTTAIMFSKKFITSLFGLSLIIPAISGLIS